MYKLIIIFIFIFNTAWSANKIAIKAIVGDEIITSYDIEERIKLISFTSNVKFNNKNLLSVKNQVREVLIAEALQLQESKKYNLMVNEEKVDLALDSIIKNNNLSKKSFLILLDNNSIDIESLRKQIRISLSWQNFILYKIKPLINISNYEIENYYKLNNNTDNLFEYLIEIAVFPIIDGNNDLVFSIYNKIKKNKLLFNDIIKDFGRNNNKSSAIWYSKHDLEEEIKKLIDDMDINEISAPIKVSNNYYLVSLKNKRFIDLNKNNNKDTIINKLFMQKLQKKIDSYIKNIKQNYLIERKS